MGHFTTLIEEALRAAESRAHDLGAFLAETARSTAEAIGDHFDDIRATTGREGEKATAALEDVYGQAVRDMERLFGEAVDRFRGSAGEVTEMAAVIGREFEATRADLQRATIDLPRETAEQAVAVRRVIGQQVEALEALTAIIAHVGESGGAGDAPPVAAALPVEETAAPMPAPVAATPAVDGSGTTGAARAAPRRTTKRAGGWLSDLLAKVDRDDDNETRASGPGPDGQPAPTAHLAGTSGALATLDAVASNISRLVYDTVAVDMWDRFRKGERDAFTMRLYTPAGQQTFAEIRRRYDEDSDFRSTVDRYIQEFERLLASAGHDEDDGARVRGIIAGATGRVYVLLAHAAGRFG